MHGVGLARLQKKVKESTIVSVDLYSGEMFYQILNNFSRSTQPYILP